jgi:radical SAM superfamily enzyme YgiQ (UPF0313 family)
VQRNSGDPIFNRFSRKTMRIKLILPALMEAKSPYWRPIKYSLFPPLGLATLASYLSEDDDVQLVDEHVEEVNTDDDPELVIIQVYVTNAKRAYALADHYRNRGAYVILGGLHVTSLPQEAALHADSIFLGPGEDTLPQFLDDFRRGEHKPVYVSSSRSLVGTPPVRRDLIKRDLYLVPNSIVVSRGCPHHCNFCYKDAFFDGGRSFYVQRVDDALAEIDRLPGRHLYFLDDHLLGHTRFATQLFDGMQGMNRLFQGASTVDAILRGDLIERAVKAGLRSIFVGFESLHSGNLARSGKKQNLGKDYQAVVRRLDELGVMINGSFVFGLDEDDPSVFRRTVDWAVDNGLTTATFHILTPYPGTALFGQMERDGRILTRDWGRYTTREVVYKTLNMTPEQIKAGYDWSYREFYRWSNILKASGSHERASQQVRHFAYAAGWKKFEATWNALIKLRQLNSMLPVLESLLSTLSEGMKTELFSTSSDSESFPRHVG